MSGSVSASLRRLVFRRAHGVCEYCLIHQDDAFFSYHVDHIVSRKQRGNSDAANLALACLRCNLAKGTDPGAFVGDPPRLVRHYHPRRDRWTDHLRLLDARIVPLSDEGEATVHLLDLNAADRMLLRECLIAAGRYPLNEALIYLSEPRD